MLDKELDLLFKQTFEPFEPEVPASLWNKITEGLDKEVTTKAAPVKKLHAGWLAAASVVVLLVLFFWMNRPGETIKLQGKKETGLVLRKEPVSGPAQNVEALPHAMQELPAPATVSSYSRHISKVQKPERTSSSVPASSEPVLASVNDQPVSVDVSPEVDKVQPAALKSAFRTNTHVTAPVLAVADCVDVADPYGLNKQKNKIRTLGGLVNYVVSKVDKRDDKIIEFTDGDEGTELTGLNLGLFKVKSKNNSTNK